MYSFLKNVLNLILLIKHVYNIKWKTVVFMSEVIETGASQVAQR